MALPAIVGALLRGVLKEIAKTGGKQAILKSAIKSLPKTLQQEGVKYLVKNSPVGMARSIAKQFALGKAIVTHPIKTARALTIGRVEKLVKSFKAKSPYALSKTLNRKNALVKGKHIRNQLNVINAQLKVAPLSKRLLLKKLQLEKASKRLTKLASEERRYVRMFEKEAKKTASYEERIAGLKGKKLIEAQKEFEKEVRQMARDVNRSRKNTHKLHWVKADEYNKLTPDDNEDGRYKTEGVSSYTNRDYKIINGEIYYLN